MRRMMGEKKIIRITITTNGLFAHNNIGLKINTIDIVTRINGPTAIEYKKGDVLTFYDGVGFQSSVTVDGIGHDISYGKSYSFVAISLHTINIESWGGHSGGGDN